MDPDAVGLHNHRVLMFGYILLRFGHGIHAVKYILAIAVYDPQVLET